MNEFITLYDSEREKGRDPILSYAHASGMLAFGNGSIEQLKDLYFHYVHDFSSITVSELEEIRNV